MKHSSDRRFLSDVSGSGPAAVQVGSNLTRFCPLALPGQQQVTVKLGQSVSLECLGPTDEEVLLFTWTKVGLDSAHLFFYRNGRSYDSYQHESFRGRVDLRSSLEDGDFSVVLHNVSRTDEGTFHCVIVTKRSGGQSGNLQSFVNLTVSGEAPAVDPSGSDEEQQDEDQTGRAGDLSHENNSPTFVIVSVLLLLILIIIEISSFVKVQIESFCLSLNNLKISC
ncbi:hypothetical protein CCH79_00020585, partial [Gambusia affinis]